MLLQALSKHPSESVKEHVSVAIKVHDGQTELKGERAF